MLFERKIMIKIMIEIKIKIIIKCMSEYGFVI